ncbi:leucyl aminopeptidase [Pseudomonadales bacterium]|nr:leucyl aminopeptidase [Pseudomonadales bacterium]
MNFTLASGALTAARTPCLVTSFQIAKKVAKASGNQSTFNRATQDFKDSIGNTLCIQMEGAVARLLIIGGTSEASAANFAKACDVAAKTLIKLPIGQALVALLDAKVKGKDAPWKAQTLLQAISHAAYQFNRYKSKPKPPHPLKRVRIQAPAKNTPSVQRTITLGNALDAGMALTKDLGNEPPNVCTPLYLLAEARKMARNPKVKVSHLDEKKMLSMGMGAFMAVSQGSDNPGRMIIINYSGGPKNEAPIALVGKGITFDTGGISLKPPPTMDEMKYDMGGAAAVLGATKAAIEAKLPINLLTIVAAAENMPSGGATRPGDIVTTSSGKTVEILNTDAEGRLVLCDALTHAQTFKPRTIIDVATLTGACIMALGSHASGLFANDDALADDLLEAGQDTGDRNWRLPLWDDYQAGLNSNFADMANVGGRGAGSVTAACFLARFVDDTPWAHLDIAGSAFHGGANKGSSGRPVPMLFKYLVNQS